VLRPPFPTSEYEGRVRQLQAGLADRGLAGALLTSEANYNYFTAYHHFAPWTTHCRSVFVFIPTTGEPVLLLHAFPAADARIDCWFDDVRGYDLLTYAPIDQVVSIVRELGMDGAPIGMELGAEHRIGLTAVELDDLRASLASPGVVDIGDLLWDLRVIKSEAEIGMLAESGRIAAAAFAECFANARVGMTELEVASILGQKILAEGGRVGFFIMTSGPGSYERTAGHPRDRALEPGDMLWIDLGVVYGGYWTDHCRAAVLGAASTGQRDSWDALRALTWGAVEASLPGRTPPEIVAGLDAAAAARGMELTFAAGRIGHGIGLMSTEPPHIAPYDDTTFRERMTFTIEPGWIDQELGTFVAEENLVVREGGPQLLTVTPRELVEIST
jgi:Xaa-Pro aminopeptidase